MRKTLLILISVILLLAGQVTAIDLNSSRALQYYGAATTDGNLDFQVSTDGTVDVYGNLNMNGNTINSISKIHLQNTESVSNGQIVRDNSIGFLAEWSGHGDAVLWDSYNVQANDGISVSGGKGQESNPQLSVSWSDAHSLDSSGNVQSIEFGDGSIRGIGTTSNGRLWMAPEKFGSHDFSREFGYKNSTETWYAEGGFSVENGNLDMNNNDINNIGGLQNCGSDEYVGGDGNCKTDTDTDTDNQDLADVLSNGNTADRSINMNGNNINNLNILDGNGYLDFRPNDNSHGIVLRQYDGGGNSWGGIRATSSGTLQLRADGSNYNQLNLYDSGRVEINNGNLNMQGNNVVNMGQYSTSGRDLKGSGGGRAMVTFQSSGSPTTMTINYNGDYSEVDLGSKIDMNGNKVASAAQYETNGGLTLGSCGGDNCIDAAGNDLHLNHNNGNGVQIGDNGGNLYMNSQNIQQMGNLRSNGNLDIRSGPGNRILLRSRGSGGKLGWYDDNNNRWVQEYNNGGNLLLDPVGNVKLENANLNVNGNQLDNVGILRWMVISMVQELTCRFRRSAP